MLTNSHDVTSDVLVQCLEEGEVFRLNVDQWRDYRLSIFPGGFSVSDCLSRTLAFPEISHLYWRKPFDSVDDEFRSGTEEAWERAQRRYVVREIANLCRRAGVPSLVDPEAERRVGKLVQLEVAGSLLRVPRWWVWQGARPNDCADEDVIVKSFVMEPLGSDDSFLYATAVDSQELDERHLWFMQRRVVSRADVTVVFIDGSTHFFRRARGNDEATDWRVGLVTGEPWTPKPADATTVDGIRSLMSGLGLRFGRLDFAEDEAGRLWFLEVNPNGQFAWLDPTGDGGLLHDLVASLRNQPRC